MLCDRSVSFLSRAKPVFLRAQRRRVSRRMIKKKQKSNTYDAHENSFARWQVDIGRKKKKTNQSRLIGRYAHDDTRRIVSLTKLFYSRTNAGQRCGRRVRTLACTRDTDGKKHWTGLFGAASALRAISIRVRCFADTAVVVVGGARAPANRVARPPPPSTASFYLVLPQSIFAYKIIYMICI